MPAPQSLPTPVWHLHAWDLLLPHSTHLGAPAAWGPGGCRRPRRAAVLQAPTADTPAAGGSCFGWGLGDAGAGCPGGGHLLQRNHRWEGAGVTHTLGHPHVVSHSLQTGVVSPADGQDGARGPGSREMLQSCSTHCSLSTSSSTEGCAGLVLPGVGDSRWEVSQPQNQPCLSLPRCPPKKTGGLAPTWEGDFWGHLLQSRFQLQREAGWGLTAVDGGHPASPCPAFQLAAGLQLRSTPRTQGCNA